MEMCDAGPEGGGLGPCGRGAWLGPALAHMLPGIPGGPGGGPGSAGALDACMPILPFAKP